MCLFTCRSDTFVAELLHLNDPTDPDQSIQLRDLLGDVVREQISSLEMQKKWQLGQTVGLE